LSLVRIVGDEKASWIGAERAVAMGVSPGARAATEVRVTTTPTGTAKVCGANGPQEFVLAIGRKQALFTNVAEGEG
jgi:hypothetical protein